MLNVLNIFFYSFVYFRAIEESDEKPQNKMVKDEMNMKGSLK